MPQLTSATVSRRPHQVVLTYTVDGDIPMGETTLLSTTLVGGEDGPVHQFGVKWVNERVVSAFVFDGVAAHQHNYSQVSPQRTGDRWTVVFPTEGLGIAESGKWSATLNVNGVDLASIDGTI